jgi:hypothetical protein
MTCIEYYNDIQTRLNNASSDANAQLNLLLDLQRRIRADRDAYCDTSPGAPRANAVCCGRFLDMTGNPNFTRDWTRDRDIRVSMVQQALASIDCGQPDWQQRVIDAQQKLLELLDFVKELKDEIEALSQEYATKGQGCPTAVVVPGD